MTDDVNELVQVGLQYRQVLGSEVPTTLSFYSFLKGFAEFPANWLPSTSPMTSLSVRSHQIEPLQHSVPSRQQITLPSTHRRVSPMKSITQQPLPRSLCSSAVRSELLTCADLLQHLANSLELSGSVASILQQKVDPIATRVVLASKPTDMGMLADPGTGLTAAHGCRPKKRWPEDDASANTASKGKSRICQHGRRRSVCKECGGSSICPHGRRRYDCKECGGSSICQLEDEVVPVVPNAPPQEQPEVPPAGVEVEVEEAQPPRPCGHKANNNGSCRGNGSRGCEHGAKIKQWMEEKVDKEKAKKKADGDSNYPTGHNLFRCHRFCGNVYLRPA